LLNSFIKNIAAELNSGNQVAAREKGDELIAIINKQIWSPYLGQAVINVAELFEKCGKIHDAIYFYSMSGMLSENPLQSKAGIIRVITRNFGIKSENFFRLDEANSIVNGILSHGSIEYRAFNSACAWFGRHEYYSSSAFSFRWNEYVDNLLEDKVYAGKDVTEDIIIWSAFHKQAPAPLSIGSKVFSPIHAGKKINDGSIGFPGDDTGDSISELNKLFGELTAMYWVWKNYAPSEFVGFCHYRRYPIFNLYYDNTNYMDSFETIIDGRVLSDMLKKFDIITQPPTLLPCSLKDQWLYTNWWKASEMREYWSIMENELNVMFPEYKNIIKQTLESPRGIILPRLCNIFITKWEIFTAIMDSLFGVLFSVKRQIEGNGRVIFCDHPTRASAGILGGMAERVLTVIFEIYKFKGKSIGEAPVWMPKS